MRTLTTADMGLGIEAIDLLVDIALGNTARALRSPIRDDTRATMYAIQSDLRAVRYLLSHLTEACPPPR